MSNETKPVSLIKPIVYSIADKTIEDWAAMYMPLTVKSVDDKEGLKVIHDARMTVKNTRIAIEKARLGFNAEHQDAIRIANAEAKRLTSLLEPIEKHLQTQEENIEREKERIKQEKIDQQRARIQKMIDALSAVGDIVTIGVVATMTDEAFAERLQKSTEAHAEKQRIEAEEKARKEAEEHAKQEAMKAESERLERERAELEALRQKQEAEQREREAEQAAILAKQRAEIEAVRKQQEEERAKLLAEQQAIEAEKKEAQRQRELEEAKAKAAEDARIAEANRIREEQERAELLRLKAEQEAARLEALKPDIERVDGIAKELESIGLQCKAIADEAIRASVRNAIVAAYKAVSAIIMSMEKGEQQ